MKLEYVEKYDEDGAHGRIYYFKTTYKLSWTECCFLAMKFWQHMINPEVIVRTYSFNVASRQIEQKVLNIKNFYEFPKLDRCCNICVRGLSRDMKDCTYSVYINDESDSVGLYIDDEFLKKVFGDEYDNCDEEKINHAFDNFMDTYELGAYVAQAKYGTTIDTAETVVRMLEDERVFNSEKPVAFYNDLTGQVLEATKIDLDIIKSWLESNGVNSAEKLDDDSCKEKVILALKDVFKD